MSALVPNLFKFATRTVQQIVGVRHFHALPISINNNIVAPSIQNPISLDTVRTKVRDYFPKSSEYKRLIRHGWRVRLSTKNGRRIIMRRILKGRWVLSH